jgi:hypothetical protein
VRLLALQTFIARSYNGNFGKRAGAICSMLGQCPATIGSCSITAGSSTGVLDTCTAEGVAGGSVLPGVVASLSEWRIRTCMHRLCWQHYGGAATAFMGSP